MDTDQESTCSKLEAAETVLMFNQKTISACAEACNIDPKLIECIYPAHQEQEHRMNHQIHNRTYLEQIVLQFDLMASVQQHKFLIKVIDTIRMKNNILRTRLVKHEKRSLRGSFERRKSVDYRRRPQRVSPQEHQRPHGLWKRAV